MNANNVSGESFGGFGAVDEDDEEALIQRALEMSMMDAQPAVAAPSSSSESLAEDGSGSASVMEEEDEV